MGLFGAERIGLQTYLRPLRWDFWVPGHDGIRARGSQSMLIGLEGHPCYRLLPRRSDLFCRHPYSLQFLVGIPPETWDA